MNHDFGKKLKEIERLSQDYSECKHSLQDLKYRYNNLELQKQDKEEKLRQMNTKNDNLTSELQIVKENDQKNATSKIQEFKKKIKTLDDDNSALQKLCKINKDKANKCASLVDEFNEDFLSYAKETHFDKKLISRKYRDFIILADKIKPAKQADQIQDVLEKIEDWISHSAEEFEIQMKNAANFKKKYLNVSERVDQLEDHQMNLKNGENR